MGIRSSAGSTISIATTSGVATVDAAGFAAKTYTEIKFVSTIGDFGKSYNKIDFLPLATRIKLKLKGSIEAGNAALEYAIDATDAGQLLLLGTALNSDDSWAFKIVKQGGAIKYFTAKVMSGVDKIGGADSVNMGTTSLEIDSEIIPV